MKFADIDPQRDEPPDEWIVEFGEKEAKRRYTIAKASWLSAKEAPIALSIAPKLVLGIASVRAKRNEVKNPVTINNIVGVQIPSPQEVDYPRLVVKSG